jgi:hypothetical protein
MTATIFFIDLRLVTSILQSSRASVERKAEAGTCLDSSNHC